MLVTLLKEPLVQARIHHLGAPGGVVSSIIESTREINGTPQVRLAPYHVVMARALTKDEEVWKLDRSGSSAGVDVNGEFINCTVGKSYTINGALLRPGKYSIFIVNGQTFSHQRNEELLYRVVEEVITGTYLLSQDQTIYLTGLGERQLTDMILGENIVHTPGSEFEKVRVYTLQQYAEAQRDPEFLIKNPTFIGVLSEEEINRYDYLKTQYGGGLHFANDQEKKILLDHIPSFMWSGTEQIWKTMLRKAEEKYNMFQTFIPTRRRFAQIVNVREDHRGFEYNTLTPQGRSISASPEALEALVTAYFSTYQS